MLSTVTSTSGCSTQIGLFSNEAIVSGEKTSSAFLSTSINLSSSESAKISFRLYVCLPVLARTESTQMRYPSGVLYLCCESFSAISTFNIINSFNFILHYDYIIKFNINIIRYLNLLHQILYLFSF